MCLSNYFPDDNECSSSSACGSADCNNQQGTYTCVCGPGWMFDPSTMACLGR